jgi:hypothetical protein
MRKRTGFEHRDKMTKRLDPLLKTESYISAEIEMVYETLFSDGYKNVSLDQTRGMIYQLQQLYRELFHIKNLIHEVEIDRASGAIAPWE